MRKSVRIVLVSLLLASCSEGHVSFPISESGQEKLPPEVEVVRLSSSNIAQYTTPERIPASEYVPEPQVWNYKVGVGDVLSIDVFDHPELTLPGGAERSPVDSGFRVQANGTFYYPFVGQIQASGRAPETIREDLREKLAEYIPNPELEVRVAAFNSQSVIVSGEVRQPNRQALTTVPKTVLEALNAAGGITETADLSHVKLLRGTKTYNINLETLLSGDGSRNNPLVRDGDVISVPVRTLKEAYLLGQIMKPASVDLSTDRVTLTQALTRQGGLKELSADARGVFVFRKAGAKIKVFQLQADSPTGLVLGTNFLLEPNDVVYVTRSPIGTWNDTITRLLPSINVINRADDLNL